MYRKKYLIGIYAPIEKGETLLALLNGTAEFAELMGIREDNARQILSMAFKTPGRRIRFLGELCEVAFIEEE